MYKELEKMDKSMKILSENLMRYGKDTPIYQKSLNNLAAQYQACKILLKLADDGINNTYYFKYADFDEIETILANAGYLEQPKKPASR